MTLVVLEELVGSHDETIVCTQHLGIFLIAGSESVVIDHLVEVAATLHDGCVVVAQLLECVEDGLSVACIVSLIVLLHILHVVDLIIADHEEVGSLLHLAEVVAECESRHVAERSAPHRILLGRGELAALHEILLGSLTLHDCHISVDCRNI